LSDSVLVIPPFEELFEDPSLPLVVDLGCGYGVTLLSLCHSLTQHHHHQHLLSLQNLSNTDSTDSTDSWRGINFIGVDMNDRAIRYASGLSSRWNMSHRCRFIRADCTSLLSAIQEKYSGHVSLIIVNFPTPYYANYAENGTAEIGSGNSQLPRNINDFMFNQNLLSLIRRVFQKSNSIIHHTKSNYNHSCLLIQSNVEDVALTMSNIIESSGKLPTDFDVQAIKNAVNDIFQLSNISSAFNWSLLNDETSYHSRRDRDWLRSNGNNHRAFGVGWLDQNPLPFGVKSETEASCNLNRKKIFRKFFVFDKLLSKY
jgi:SAM-dependent methyltransferase